MAEKTTPAQTRRAPAARTRSIWITLEGPDIIELKQIALDRRHGIPFLLDAAQTAGAYPIDVEAMGVDLLAFAGHKGLYGPHGTGGLVVRPGLALETWVEGGGGGRVGGGDYAGDPSAAPGGRHRRVAGGGAFCPGAGSWKR